MSIAVIHLKQNSKNKPHIREQIRIVKNTSLQEPQLIQKIEILSDNKVPSPTDRYCCISIYSHRLSS